jgi:histidine decarboxylase
MPSVTVGKLDDFVEELVEARKLNFPDGNVIVPCIVEEIGPQNCACSLHRGAMTTPPKAEKPVTAPLQNGKQVMGPLQ